MINFVLKDRLTISTTLENKKFYIFQVSFITSSVLCLIGILLVILSKSPGILLVGLLAILVGGIQVLIDLGWISIIKINHNLTSWSEAYKIVIKQREQKFFLFPVYIDILFIAISLGSVISFSV